MFSSLSLLSSYRARQRLAFQRRAISPAKGKGPPPTQQTHWRDARKNEPLWRRIFQTRAKPFGTSRTIHPHPHHPPPPPKRAYQRPGVICAWSRAPRQWRGGGWGEWGISPTMPAAYRNPALYDTTLKIPNRGLPPPMCPPVTFLRGGGLLASREILRP